MPRSNARAPSELFLRSLAISPRRQIICKPGNCRREPARYALVVLFWLLLLMEAGKLYKGYRRVREGIDFAKTTRAELARPVQHLRGDLTSARFLIRIWIPWYYLHKHFLPSFMSFMICRMVRLSCVGNLIIAVSFSLYPIRIILPLKFYFFKESKLPMMKTLTPLKQITVNSREFCYYEIRIVLHNNYIIYYVSVIRSNSCSVQFNYNATEYIFQTQCY